VLDDAVRRFEHLRACAVRGRGGAERYEDVPMTWIRVELTRASLALFKSLRALPKSA